jgi:hypothetical protein
LQEADRKDVEQTVWLNMLTRGKREELDKPEAYLTTVTRNAVTDFFKRKHQPCRDERQTLSLDDDDGGMELPDERPANPADAFESRRTRLRVRALRGALTEKEAACFDAVMAQDFNDAPKKEQTKVVAIVKRVLALPVRPRSVEHPDPLDGPEHCGETVRRLRLVVDQRRDVAPVEDPYLDAAE